MDILWGCHGLLKNFAYCVVIVIFNRTIKIWLCMYLIININIICICSASFSGTNKRTFQLLYEFPKGLACIWLMESFTITFFSIILLFLCVSVFTVHEIVECFISLDNCSNRSYKWHLFPWIAVTTLAVCIRTAGSSVNWGKHHRLLTSTDYLLVYIFQKKGTGALAVCIFKIKWLLKICLHME